MRKTAFLALLLPLVMALNCPADRFAIVMERTPDGKVQRELTVWTAEGEDVNPPAEEVLATARSAYDDPGTEVDQKHRFSGTFADRLPPDLVHAGLTNCGVFGSHRSRMGSVLVYMERMPGQPNLVELFRRGEQFTDTLVQALSAWARQQPSLGREPEKLEKLISFLQTEFRDDVLNAMLMGWQAIVRGQGMEDRRLEAADNAEEEFWTAEWLRLANYAVERGYLRPDELPLLSDDSGPLVYRAVLRKAASAMGYSPTEPLPPGLAEIADPDDFDTVLGIGLNAISVSAEEFEEQISPALPMIFGRSTGGTVVWRCKIEPLLTNGTWKAEECEVSWDAAGREGCTPPQLLFAAWAEPDEPFQQRHLGRVMLEGEALAEYIAWQAGLTPPRQAEWDAFVDGLQPGPDLFENLRKFRFRSPEPSPSTAPATAPAEEIVRGAKLILGRE
jgi:hypothetical protein